MGCNSGSVSWAISISGGWYAWTIDIGRDEERSVLVLVWVEESCAGPGRCFGVDVEVASGAVAWRGGVEVGVGDFGGPPKADINDRTDVGSQDSELGLQIKDSYLWNDPFGTIVRKFEVIQAGLSLSSSPWNSEVDPETDLKTARLLHKGMSTMILHPVKWFDDGRASRERERLSKRQELKRESH